LNRPVRRYRFAESGMKLEFLAGDSPDYPLLRRFAFTPAEAGLLLLSVTGLASGVVERVDVDDLPFVEPIGGCRLALARQSWDGAILRIGPSAFECGFTVDTWDNVASLIEPFTVDLQGYQWLAESPGEAALLLSPSGQW
jgi:hypothetical protein